MYEDTKNKRGFRACMDLVQTSHLVKDLQVGENVRAVGGVNAGHSGLITSIDFNRQTATVFSPAAGLEVGELSSVFLGSMYRWLRFSFSSYALWRGEAMLFISSFSSSVCSSERSRYL